MKRWKRNKYNLKYTRLFKWKKYLLELLFYWQSSIFTGIYQAALKVQEAVVAVDAIHAKKSRQIIVKGNYLILNPIP